MATPEDAVDWGLAHIDAATKYSLNPRELDPTALTAGGLIRFVDCSALITLCFRAVGLFDRLLVPAYGSTYAYMLAMGKLTNTQSSPGTGVGAKKNIGTKDWKRFQKLVEWDNTQDGNKYNASEYIYSGLQKGDILIRYPYSPGRDNSQGHMAFVVNDYGGSLEVFEALPSPADPQVGLRYYEWYGYAPDDISSNFNLAVRPTPYNETPQPAGPTFVGNS